MAVPSLPPYFLSHPIGNHFLILYFTTVFFNVLFKINITPLL